MRIYRYLASFCLAVSLCFAYQVSAQNVGAPTGAVTFDTNFAGSGTGALGHLQAGPFGNVGNPTANWAALGQAPVFPGAPLVYGLRLQRNRQYGLFKLVDYGGVED